MITSGELRDELIVQVKEDIIDENGFSETTFVDKMVLYCKKKTVSTKEFYSSQVPLSKHVLRFICRKREVDNKMYVYYKEERYNITHVHEIDTDFMELSCERID